MNEELFCEDVFYEDFENWSIDDFLEVLPSYIEENNHKYKFSLYFDIDTNKWCCVYICDEKELFKSTSHYAWNTVKDIYNKLNINNIQV